MGKTKNTKNSAKPTVKKKLTGESEVGRDDAPRKLKVAPYKSFKLQKKINSPHRRIPGSLLIFKNAIAVLISHWGLFLGIIVVYALLSIMLAGSLTIAGSIHLNEYKPVLDKNFGKPVAGISLFAYIVQKSVTGGTFQTLLAIIVSLALIWAIRQVYVKGNYKIRIRDSFYRGMAPLIPFMLVLLVLFVELIPLALGLIIYTSASSTGTIQTTPEQLIFAFISFLLALATFHMLTSSVFALYIVTLPDMTPVKALRSAVRLVRYRRVQIFIKFIFLIITLTVIATAIIVPLALFATPSAPYVFFALSLIFLAIAHSYIYALYRELI